MASKQWYQTNQTQPNVGQPWYHVLVDGTNQVTYAAQDSLQPDTSDTPINHPLIDHFFSEFKDAHYVRKDAEWPG